MTAPAYVTVKSVAALLNVSTMTVLRRVRDGDFPGTIRDGRIIRIPLRAVRTYLGEHEVGRGGKAGVA